MSDQLEPYIDPDLEARIVAMVLGEASQFEIEAIEKEIEAKLEVKLFYQRILHLHQLLDHTKQDDRQNSDREWKLSEDKRIDLIASLSASSSSTEIESERCVEPNKPSKLPWKILIVAAAAVIMLMGVASIFSPSGRFGADSSLLVADAGEVATWEKSIEPISGRSIDVNRQTDGVDVSMEAKVHDSLIKKETALQEARKSDPKSIFGRSSNSHRGLSASKPSFGGLGQSLSKGTKGPSFTASRRKRLRSGGSRSAITIPGQASTNKFYDTDKAKSRFLERDFGIGDGGAAAISKKPNIEGSGGRKDRVIRRELSLRDLASRYENSSNLFGTSYVDSVGDSSGLDPKAFWQGEQRRGESENFSFSRDLTDDERDELSKLKFVELASPKPGDDGLDTRKLGVNKSIANKSQRQEPFIDLAELSASKQPFSTFSLHVSDVSFKLAHANFSQGKWPDAQRIRIEEFVNAMDYFDSTPSASEKVSATVEQAIHPTLQQRNLLRLSLKTAEFGRSSLTPLNLVLLVDSSGSMERFDRQETLSRALSLLAEQLTPQDKVTLISFARRPRLVADGLSGDQCKQLVRLVTQLPEEGGTNLEAALKLAHEKALEYHKDSYQSRIILLTDGAANLGNADPEQLSEMVIQLRNEGLAFDAAGIGADGLNDEILEALTRKGNGRYYLLNKPEDADANFAKQIAGSLRPAAMNVKVQVVFNPLRVGKYQLHGYEKHRLNKEDFKNDQADAAELSAAEAGVALYHFEPLPEGSGDIGEVKVRFRDMSTGEMFENSWPIPYNPSVRRYIDATDTIKLATTATITASKLKGEALGRRSEWKDLSATINTLDSRFINHPSVKMLSEIIQKAITTK